MAETTSTNPILPPDDHRFGHWVLWQQLFFPLKKLFTQ